MGITEVQVETDSMLLKMALDGNTFELAAIVLRSRILLMCTLSHVWFHIVLEFVIEWHTPWRRKGVSVLVTLSCRGTVYLQV
jgi:hypothetical protein